MKPVTTEQPMFFAARAVYFICSMPQVRIASSSPAKALGAKPAKRGSPKASPTH